MPTRYTLQFLPRAASLAKVPTLKRSHDQKHKLTRYRPDSQVIPNVGLCISLLDILSASEGAVLYGDGCLYYKSKSHTALRALPFRIPGAHLLTLRSSLCPRS